MVQRASTGPVDGIFGSATQAAVVAFQRAKGLSPDGFAGPLTISALTQTGTPPTGTATGLSLHIGLNSVDPAAYPLLVPVLAGCVNDANDMQDLARRQGLPPAPAAGRGGHLDGGARRHRAGGRPAVAPATSSC